jgi:hypothetical protein
MKPLRRRLTYANVMSSIAVFLVLAGGTAFAASQLGKESVGTKQLKKEAVSLAKINAAAKKSLKGAAGPAGAKGATGPQGAKGDKGDKGDTGPSTGPAGGVLTGNYPNPGLAANSVTTEKVAPSARSHAYQVYHEGTQNIEIPTGLLGNFATATAVSSLTLPAGDYLVTASTEFVNSAIAARSAICRLFEGTHEIGEGSTPIGEAILSGQGTAIVTALSSGGTLTLRCRASGNDVFDWNSKVDAISVQEVN